MSKKTMPSSSVKIVEDVPSARLSPVWWFPKPRKAPIYELINASFRRRYFFLDIYYLNSKEVLPLAVSHLYWRYDRGSPKLSFWFRDNYLEVFFPFEQCKLDGVAQQFVTIHYGDPEFTSKIDSYVLLVFKQ